MVKELKRERDELKADIDSYAKASSNLATELYEAETRLAGVAAENERLRKAASDWEERFWRRDAQADRSEALSALDTHPRAANTVVPHETANVGDKPEGQQELVAVSVADIKAWRAEWMVANDPQEGTDCVTPFDKYLYTRPSEQAATPEAPTADEIAAADKASGGRIPLVDLIAALIAAFEERGKRS